MKVILILVDALRYDYLTEKQMPFLYEFAQNNIRVEKVKPGFSFCERTEIFTGMTARKSGNFTAIGYNEGKSEYRKFKWIFKLLGKIKNKVVDKYVRRLLSIIFSRLHIKMGFYKIPFNMIPNLYLTEDQKSHYNKNAFVKESIFDVLLVEEKKFFVDTFTHIGSRISMNDEKRVEKILEISDVDYDFEILYLGKIDEEGHKNKVGSVEMQNNVSVIDNYIKEIWQENSVKDIEFRLAVLGDHGMVDIQKKIDILSLCSQLPYKLWHDYEVFLDSTIARFWFKEEKTKGHFREHFESHDNHFFILSEAKADTLNIPINHGPKWGEKTYGDLIVCAREGVLFSPDFFHSEEEDIKGMHGYPVESDNSLGLFVTNYKGKRKQIRQCDLIDICPTLSKLLNIRIPNGNEGKSIL